MLATMVYLSSPVATPCCLSASLVMLANLRSSSFSRTLVRKFIYTLNCSCSSPYFCCRQTSNVCMASAKLLPGVLQSLLVCRANLSVKSQRLDSPPVPQKLFGRLLLFPHLQLLKAIRQRIRSSRPRLKMILCQSPPPAELS